MKKITLLMSFLMLLGWQVKAQFGCGSAVVITNGFTQNGITTPGTGGIEDWNINPTGTSVNALYWDDDVYLFEYTAGVTAEQISMTIFTRSSWNGIGIFDDCIGTTFSNELDADASTGGNISHVVTATIAPGNTVYIAVGQWGTPNNLDFDVTNFTVTQILCPDPTVLTATNITTTTADLGWTEMGSATQWDIEYGATPFTPTGVPTITGTTTNPHNLTLLAANTSYTYYVRADCGVDSSAWVGPFTFTTACAAVVAPWNEDFENAGVIPNCWKQGVANAEAWRFSNTGTGNHIGNNGVMNGATTSGAYFAWVDDSSPHSLNTTLESPLVDVSALTTPELSFYLISNNEGFTNVGFSIDVWDGAAWNVGFYTHNTNTIAGAWEKIVVNLSTLTITGDIQFRFIVNENNGTDFYDDVAIDDVDVHEAPACPAPSALTATNITATTADLGWTEMGSATQWDIEYGATPFTPTGVPTITGTTTNPHNLTPLTANTSYAYYVRADCGVDSSVWVGPFTFTTACNAFAVPFVENFNSTSPTENCWTVINNNGDGDFWNMNYTSNPLNGDQVAMMYTDGNGGANDDYLVTPTLTLTGNERLRFHYRVQSSGEPNDFQVTLSTTGVGVGNFTNTLMPLTSVSNTTYQEQIINLSAYTGNVNIAFHVPAGGLDGWRLYIDSVVVEANPACPAPTALTATNITATSADLGWTEMGSATQWDIEYGATPFTPTGVPTITGTTTNPHNLTPLTANTSYTYYVRADCGVDSSAWVGPFTFFTGYCTPSSSGSSTYVNNFTTTNGSANISNLASGFTPGGYFNGSAQFVQSYATGTFDFNAAIVGGSAGFSIWVDWNNDLVFDNLTEKVFNTTSFSNGPYLGTITIPALTPLGNYRMRITTDWNASNPANPCAAVSRGEFEDYTITVVAPPACPAPTALTATNITATSADLGWTEMGSATQWDIEYGATPFTPTGVPTITGTTTNPHNLTPLTASTTYVYYVRADCGVDSSTWVGPFTFTTSCASYVAPYLEQFNVASLPACWSQSGATAWEYGSNATTPTGFADYGADLVPDHSTPATGTFIGMDGSDNTDGEVSVLLSPFIDASPLTTPHLSYWIFSNNVNDAAQNKLIVELWDGAAWNFIDSIQSNLGTSWVNFDTVLTSLTITGDVQVRFTITGVANGGSTYYNDILIDDVQIYEPLANDVGVISIASAPASCGLGMETVTVKVKNYGSLTQSGFDVIYSLNGVPVTPETVVGSVLPGDTLTHVFTALANMSTPNNYTINAWSLLATDGNNANDTLNGWMTEHIASSLTFNGNDTVHSLLPNGSNTIVCTNGLVNNMLDTCYRLSALVIDSLMHTWNSDLDIWLISPAGDTLEISTDNGGSTDNYINVTFTDTATTNIAGNNPVPGFYHTEELVGLYKFNGTNPEGAWTLKVIDDTGGDNGTLFKWHLEFTDYNFVVDLGADTTACPADVLTFNAGTGNYSYVWSTGDTTEQISVDTNSLGGNGTYNISVVVTDTISGCQSTDTIVVTFSPCAGINGLANNVNMNVYPNPNNGEFTLNINTTDVNELDVKVMNTQGQVVYAKNNYTNVTNINDRIDLSDNANGIYFIVITTEKGIVTHKLVIQ